MPRREILSPAQREALLVIPVDRAGLIENYVLSEQDLSLIRLRRGDHNRLGIEVQLALVRFPGIALQAGETPPQELIAYANADLQSLSQCLRINASEFKKKAKCARPTLTPDGRPAIAETLCSL
jgi:TnpA family transposase